MIDCDAGWEVIMGKVAIVRTAPLLATEPELLVAIAV
jgi:hypothetical protein